jgi:enamine deaminase RidA (YjgF/YER057c/UK114 family)
MSIARLNPITLHKTVGYSHVVRAVGDLLVVSGQTALDPAGNLVGPGDLRAQTVQTFENVGAALRAMDADFEHIIKLTYFVVNYDLSHRDIVLGVRDQFIDRAHAPASTLLGVQALALPGYLIEIEALAVVPSS